MSGPYRTLQKFLVLKMMEKHSVPTSSQVQQEIIDNALATSKAIHEIERMNRDMFSWNSPQQKQPQPQQQQGFANPQQPAIDMSRFQMPPITPQQQKKDIDLGEMTIDDMTKQQQAYQDMAQQQDKIRLYNQSAMEINRMLMQMQQEFFQNIQKVQQQLNEIMRSLFVP